MKNDFLNKIDIKAWIIVMAVIIIRVLIYNAYANYSIFFDTTSYMEFDANIFQGEIDSFRTPIYPNFLNLMDIINQTETTTYIYVAFFQEVISIISVLILYFTLAKTFKSKIATIATTLIYACFPAIFTYNRVILTESLSTSFFVMYFCLILRYIANASNKKAIAIGLFTIFLIFLRPSFLYLVVALAILFLLMYFCKKIDVKQLLIGGAALVCICSSVLGYSYLNKIQNGFFGLSNVTHINQLDIIIRMRIYDTGEAKDQEIIKIIEQNLESNNTVWFRRATDKIMSEYTPEQVDAYISRCIKNNFTQYLKKNIEKIFVIGSVCCDEIYLRATTRNSIQPIIPFMVVYLYLIFEAIYLIVKGIKNKKLHIEQTIILITILGQLATNIIGAQAEYSRLFVTALPILILSIGWHIEEILSTREKALLERFQKADEISREVEK